MVQVAEGYQYNPRLLPEKPMKVVN
jgi:hypothetical protein